MQISKSLLYAGIGATLAPTTLGAFLFHGTSMVIYPSNISSEPRDSKFEGSNFFSYGTELGYISFGWWLPAEPGNHHQHCVARPKSYDWYEYGIGNCSDVGCNVHAVNYLTKDTSKPYIDSPYVSKSLDFGNGEKGQMALSYFDKAQDGGYGVGTRLVLSDNPAEVEDCHGAFETLQEMQKERQTPIKFQLINPCSPLSTDAVSSDNAQQADTY